MGRAWVRLGGQLVAVRLTGVARSHAGTPIPFAPPAGLVERLVLPGEITYDDTHVYNDGGVTIMVGTAVQFAADGLVVGHHYRAVAAPGRPLPTSPVTAGLWRLTSATEGVLLGGPDPDNLVEGVNYVNFGVPPEPGDYEALYGAGIPVNTVDTYVSAARIVGTYAAIPGFFAETRQRDHIIGPAGINGRYAYSDDFLPPGNVSPGGAFYSGVGPLFVPA